MKKYIFLFTVLMLSGCQQKISEETIQVIDVNATYPERELVLQDIADVEYIPLETIDSFITAGIVKAVGNEYILTANQGSDGIIYMFDRKTGNAVRTINRRGQGGEEYTQVTSVILDESADELFVFDYPARKVYVYDLQGNFSRNFSFADSCYYSFSANYDSDQLICYKYYSSVSDEKPSSFVLISKQNGRVTSEIPIPENQAATPVWKKDGAVVTPGSYVMTPVNDQWFLGATSSDTIYKYSSEGRLQPAFVRTPSVHLMDPQVFLFPIAFTDRYDFAQLLTKKFDLETGRGFPSTDLAHDKTDDSWFEYTVYNTDYVPQKAVSLNPFYSNPVNPGIITTKALDADQLIEANEKGELKGKLKDIAATLTEDANPVIMLVKHKS